MTIMSEVEHSQRELEKRLFHLKTLHDLSQEIGFLNGVQEITKNLLMMVMGNFGVLSGVILLIDVKKKKIETMSQRGMSGTSMNILSGAVESGLFDDAGGREEGKEEKVCKLLSSVNLRAWVPFGVSGDLKGLICLGDKISEDPYTPDDQELLITLAHHGAFAIHNARLVEQMRKDEIVRTNLARYLSPQIVDHIIHKDIQVNLGGSRKVVTVLFSDIRNFTAITETRPPDQLVHILNDYFTEMSGIIFENQGSLDKYIGDAIVSVFGSLIPLENPAASAVNTAMQMMKRMPVLNERWLREYGFSMDIGIGINTGEVFLGNIGSPERMEFTVIGDTVNVASRFSGMARANQILITHDTQAQLGSDIKVKELPPCEVKGKSGILEVFEIAY